MSLSKRAAFFVLSALWMSLTPTNTAHAQSTASPRIFYSDLESGPNTGGQGGFGAFVTIYGKGFGATQGSSVVTIGGVAAQKYLIWSDRQIAFQLGNSVVTGNIAVNVAGAASNGVPFTVRPGHIYFVSTAGNDAQRGSYARPWRTVTQATKSVVPGDIVYIMDGVSASTPDSSGASVTIARAGSNGNPIALVAYPRATVTIGSASGQTYGVRAPSGDYGYWVLAGLTLRGAIEAVHVAGTSNWRLVNNDISCPHGTGTAACVRTSSTTQIKFLGNNVHDSGSTGSNYASVQFTGSDNVEVGWNQIGNTRGCRALLFSTSGSNQHGLMVHDNYVHDAVCDGISFATVDPSQGAVVAYNNIIQHVGVGPAPGGVESSYACINAGGSGLGSVQILNNTFYDCGARGNADSGGISAATPVAVTSNIFELVAGESYVTPNTRTSDLSGSNNLFWGAGAIPAPFSASVDADPLFIDIANANLHVQPSSPAVDAGTNTGVTSDYDGVPRPQGSGYDIGAYESASGSQSAGRLVENPTSLSFGTVTVATSSTQSVTVSNSGSATVTVSQMNVTGAGFSATGLNLPATIAPGQSTSFTVTFAPQIPGRVTGSVALISAGNATSTVQLAGIGANPADATPMSATAGTASALATACSSSTTSWQSSGYAQQTGTLIAQWDATPSAQGIAAFTGFSSLAATTWTDNAAMVRFNTDNTIQALKGGTPDAYTADTAINYTAGNPYHFRLVASVSSHTYSVYVTPQGGAETLLASNYPFRSTQQTVASLSFVNTIWEAGGAASFCNFAVTPTVGTLSSTPKSVSFGNVLVGSSSTQNVTVTASTSSVTVSQANATGAGFSLSGLSLPTTLAAGQSATFQVKFAPTAAGSVTGSLSLTSNASNSPTTIALSGTGASTLPPGCSSSTASWQSWSYTQQTGTFTAQWDATPSAQGIGAFTGFSSLAASTWTDNAAMVRFNTDNTFQALKGGSPDAYTADTTINYTAGNSYHFRLVASIPKHTYSVYVTPQGGAETLLASNYPFRSTQQTVASLSFVNIIWETGSGASFCDFALTPTVGTLSSTPNSVSFGNVLVGSGATQNVTVTANTSSVTVSQANATGTGFSLSGLALPTTLAAGQSATFQVKFAPTATGSVTGSLSLTSNASNSPMMVVLSGTGATTISHSVTLNWIASTSTNVAGYYVYRGTQSGGPYTRLNGTPVAATTYTDSNVTAGTTYYYVVTAVDSTGAESAFSAQVSGTIPTP